MAAPVQGPCPPRFAEIKKEIATLYPDFEERITAAWNDLLAELEKATTEITTQGSDVSLSGRQFMVTLLISLGLSDRPASRVFTTWEFERGRSGGDQTQRMRGDQECG